jgi:hypothetical protein
MSWDSGNGRTSQESLWYEHEREDKAQAGTAGKRPRAFEWARQVVRMKPIGKFRNYFNKIKKSLPL